MMFKNFLAEEKNRDLNELHGMVTYALVSARTGPRVAFAKSVATTLDKLISALKGGDRAKVLAEIVEKFNELNSQLDGADQLSQREQDKFLGELQTHYLVGTQLGAKLKNPQPRIDKLLSDYAAPPKSKKIAGPAARGTLAIKEETHPSTLKAILAALSEPNGAEQVELYDEPSDNIVEITMEYDFPENAPTAADIRPLIKPTFVKVGRGKSGPSQYIYQLTRAKT